MEDIERKVVKDKVVVADHSGHRSRLLNTINKVGIENLSDVQAMEFILSYVIPRKDTNPTAHYVLSKFGNISNALEADEFELAAVPGLNRRSAILLKQFVDIFYLYTTSKHQKHESIKSSAQLCNYMSSMLENRVTETLCMIALNSRKEIINYELIASDSIKNIGISPKRFAQFIHGSNAAYVAIAHNHPNGDCRPSKLDLEATKKLKNLSKSMDVVFLDSLVVSILGVYSIEQSELILSTEQLNIDNILSDIDENF